MEAEAGTIVLRTHRRAPPATEQVSRAAKLRAWGRVRKPHNSITARPAAAPNSLRRARRARRARARAASAAGHGAAVAAGLGAYNNATLDELLAKIKVELAKLGPLIDLDAIREQQGVEN